MSTWNIAIRSDQASLELQKNFPFLRDIAAPWWPVLDTGRPLSSLKLKCLFLSWPLDSSYLRKNKKTGGGRSQRDQDQN